MSLDIFEDYDCDGQIEMPDLKGERMDKLIYIPADQIHEHPDNPRKDLGDLTELTESIRQNGIMQNLTVIPGYWDNKRGFHEEEYTLLIGHRRYSAGKMAAVTEYYYRYELQGTGRNHAYREYAARRPYDSGAGRRLPDDARSWRHCGRHCK